MHWLVFGDLHGDASHLDAIPELPGAEGILISGDLTMAGGVQAASLVLEPILAKGKPVFALPGNMDRTTLTGWLESKNLHLHAMVRRLPTGLECMGLGYSPPTPFHTPGEYPEEQLITWLVEAYSMLSFEAKESGHWVFITHTPPWGTRCDMLADGTHVGSKAIRMFVEDNQPALCFCGHIHESVGEDVIGNTKLYNPGPFSGGGYAVLYEEEDDRLRAELKQTER